MADVTIRLPGGTEIRWQLPDPDTDGLAADVVTAVAGLLGEPDIHTIADRLPGWPH